MRYLITGGAGFIGSHLAEALLARGDHVTVLDNLSTGSIRNIERLRVVPTFEYVIDTMEDSRLLSELVDAADAIFHMAAAVGVKLIVQSPVHTIETNVHLTELLLATAAKKGRKVFIASTSEVYGKSTQVPFREDGDIVMGATTRGRWSYACSKAIDEFLAIAYWREKHLPVVIGRFFNTVGPRQTGKYGMVLPNFVQQALADTPIIVHGDGRQTRCFTHVSDAIAGAVGLMDADHTVGQVFNIGSLNEVTILDLAERVRDLTESRSEIRLVPYSEVYGEGFEDMVRRVPALEKISQAIGYQPQFCIDEIIQTVVEYHRRGEPLASSV